MDENEHSEVVVVMVNGAKRRVVSILEDTQRYVVQEGWQLVSYPMSECQKVS